MWSLDAAIPTARTTTKTATTTEETIGDESC
jgi:hypothetical protein